MAKLQAANVGVEIHHVRGVGTASPAPVAPVVEVAEPAEPFLEECANCGRSIGRLEQPRIWGDNVVCGACHSILSSDAGTDPEPAEEETDVTQALAYATPNSRYFAGALGQSIICPNPNCGYRGFSNRRANGSMVLAVILLLLWLVPGILYLIFCGGYSLWCPQCNQKVRDDGGRGEAVASALVILVIFFLAMIILVAVVASMH